MIFVNKTCILKIYCIFKKLFENNAQYVYTHSIKCFTFYLIVTPHYILELVTFKLLLKLGKLPYEFL